MKKKNLIRMILTCLVVAMFTCMAMGSDLMRPLEETNTLRQTELREDLMKDYGLSYDEANRVIKMVENENMSYEEAINTVLSERPEQEQAAETGLPAKEIEGTYTAASILKVNMKGKDEDEPWREIDSQEIKFTITVTAIDENTIRLDMEGVKFGEGPYNPTTGICGFKLAPEFIEALNARPEDGEIRRFTFTNNDGKIQFEGVKVVNGVDDESSVMIGVKD